MIGGIKSAIGFALLLLVFVLVMIVMLCTFNQDTLFCSIFSPVISFLDMIMGLQGA